MASQSAGDGDSARRKAHETPGQTTSAQPIRAEHLDALYRADGQSPSSADMGALLQSSVESAVTALGLETGAIYTIAGGVLFLGATTPALPPDFPLHLRYALLEDHPHIDECVRTATPMYFRDATKVALAPDERHAVQARGICTLLYIPLLAEDTAVGVMLLGSQSGPADLSDELIEHGRALGEGIASAVSRRA